MFLVGRHPKYQNIPVYFNTLCPCTPGAAVLSKRNAAQQNARQNRLGLRLRVQTDIGKLFHRYGF